MAGRGRRLVAGFGYGVTSCGWAATADVVNYDVKRRLGEWESSFVGAAGPLSQVIVASSHDEAVELRDRLNAAPGASVRQLVAEARAVAPQDPASCRRSSTRRLRTTVTREEQLRGQLRELAWVVVDADERAVREAREKLIELAASQPEIPQWDDPETFPFGAVVFDLDQTLVDSSLLGTTGGSARMGDRRRRRCCASIRGDGAVPPHDLPRLLAARDVKVAIVSRSPTVYAQRVCSLFGIHADVVKAGPGEKAAKIAPPHASWASPRPMSSSSVTTTAMFWRHAR